jgi:hypothetical protein
VTGGLIVAAAVYQLTPLKQAWGEPRYVAWEQRHAQPERKQ